MTRVAVSETRSRPPWGDAADANGLFHAVTLVTQAALGYLCKRPAP